MMKSLIILAMMAVSVSAFAQSGKVTKPLAAAAVEVKDVWDYSGKVAFKGNGIIDWRAYAQAYWTAFMQAKQLKDAKLISYGVAAEGFWILGFWEGKKVRIFEAFDKIGFDFATISAFQKNDVR